MIEKQQASGSKLSMTALVMIFNLMINIENFKSSWSPEMVLVIPKYLLSLHFNALAISLAKKFIELFTIIRSWGGQHIAVVGVKVTRAIFPPFSFHILIWNKCLLSSRSSRRSTASMSGGWATRWWLRWKWQKPSGAKSELTRDQSTRNSWRNNKIKWKGYKFTENQNHPNNYEQGRQNWK